MTKEPSKTDSHTHIEHSQGPVLSGTFHGPVTLGAGPNPAPPPDPPLSAADQAELDQLYQILRARFNQEELRSLCFTLGVEYDDLGGEGHSARARELVKYLGRRAGGLERLRAAIEAERPGELGP